MFGKKIMLEIYMYLPIEKNRLNEVHIIKNCQWHFQHRAFQQIRNVYKVSKLILFQFHVFHTIRVTFETTLFG